MNLCKSQSVRSGQRCPRPAVRAGRCRLHTGRKRRSFSWPTDPRVQSPLSESLRRFKEDVELTSLREEILLTDARINDCLARVDSGECGALWRQLHRVYNRVLKAQQRRDAAAMAKALTALGSVIALGESDYGAWGEVMKWVDVRRRLADKFIAREVLLRPFIPIDRLESFMAHLAQSVRSVLKEDPDVSPEMEVRICQKLVDALQKSYEKSCQQGAAR